MSKVTLTEKGNADDGKQYIVVEVQTNDYTYLGMLAFCERYEMKMTFNQVVNYDQMLASFTIEGFGEDISLFMSEYGIEDF